MMTNHNRAEGVVRRRRKKKKKKKKKEKKRRVSYSRLSLIKSALSICFPERPVLVGWAGFGRINREDLSFRVRERLIVPFAFGDFA